MNDKRLDLAGLIYLVNKLKNKHLKVTALSEAGIHGIRYYNNKLQCYNTTTEMWTDITDSQISTLLGSETLETTSDTITGAINELKTALSSVAVAWADVSGKPATYTPSTHTHDDRYYTETEIDTKLGNLVLSTTSTDITGAINELKTALSNLSYNDLSDKPDLSSIYTYCGTVTNYSNLPSTNLKVGMVYNITNADSTHGVAAGDNLVWNGTGWDNHRGDVDLSNFVTNSALQAIVGTAALTTTATTLKEAINELNSLIGSGSGGSSGNIPENPNNTSDINIWIET